jgi:predicted amidohydrolase YtcJ
VLIVNAEVAGRPGIDVRVDAHRVLAVGAGLGRAPGEPVLDAHGGAVIPGLHDHHVHLRAAVAAGWSVRLDRVAGPEDFDRAIVAAAAGLPAGAWLRAVGWHEHTAGRVDRTRLDGLVPDRPVRLQHRGGAVWVLNTRALIETGALTSDRPGVERDQAGVASGWLWRLDGWLRERVGTPLDPAEFERDLERLTARLAGLGVTGFTDATPGREQADVDDFAGLSTSDRIGQRMLLMAPPGLRPPATDRVRLGPMKIILDDADLPPVATLAALIAENHRRFAPIAIHCVTAEQLVIAIAALEDAGPLAGDRIEHAAVVPPGTAGHLGRLGVAVVTQPGFLAERGDDYLRDVAADEQPWLYPCASLRRAGVPVAAGTDLPFGPDDPWRSIAAAIRRRSPGGRILGPNERVDPATALGLFLADPADLGRTRTVRPGESGDLCVLDRPLAEVLARLAGDDNENEYQNPVRAVVMAGRPVVRGG